MENTLEIPAVLNENIKSYLADNNDRKPKYKSQYTGMYTYPDGTHSVLHEKSQTIDVGSDFRDFKGVLNIVTEVIETRDHKGVFLNEMNRQKISIVKSTALPKM